MVGCTHIRDKAQSAHCLQQDRTGKQLSPFAGHTPLEDEAQQAARYSMRLTSA